MFPIHFSTLIPIFTSINNENQPFKTYKAFFAPHVSFGRRFKYHEIQVSQSFLLSESVVALSLVSESVVFGFRMIAFHRFAMWKLESASKTGSET